MYNKVKKYIEQEQMININDKITIGVSGGADSVCLLLMLHELKKEYNLDLTVVHVNHMVRTDAAEDALFVKELCERLDVKFVLKEIDIEKEARERHIGTEEMGRLYRYEAFNELNNDKIAVAHNKNDNVETLFLNLTRGCGLRGMCGIKNKRNNIIRPLMCLERKEIEQYLKENNQEYKTDSTNLENVYNRNKIRNNVLPELEKINCSVVNNISKTILDINELKEFLDEFVNDFINNNVITYNNTTYINLNKLNKEKNIIKKEIILTVLSRYSKNNVSSKNISDILDICDKCGRKEVNITNNIHVVKEFDSLKIYKDAEEKPLFKLKIGVNQTDIGRFDVAESISNKIYYNDNLKTVNYDIIDELYVGFIKDDAVITLNNREMKLKEYFNKEKCSALTPVIYNNEDVVWVVGHRLNEKYKVKDNTKRVLNIKNP